MLLLGQGGTGKTHLIQNVVLPSLTWAFPPDSKGDAAGKQKVLLLAYSNAQANGISTREHRAVTLHTASALRVQSLRNKDLKPKNKQDQLESTWGHLVAAIHEEVSMTPAEGYNALNLRATHG